MADDANVWRHASSSSSSGSSSDSDSEVAAAGPSAMERVWQPSVPAPRAKPKGRPRKYPVDVNTKAERKAYLSKPVAGDETLVAKHRRDELSMMLRPVGGKYPEIVGAVIARSANRTPDIAADIVKTVDAYLGPDAAKWHRTLFSMSLSRAAAILGQDPHTFKSHVFTMAQAFFFPGSRGLVSSVLFQTPIIAAGVSTSIYTMKHLLRSVCAMARRMLKQNL